MTEAMAVMYIAHSLYYTQLLMHTPWGAGHQSIHRRTYMQLIKLDQARIST